MKTTCQTKENSFSQKLQKYWKVFLYCTSVLFFLIVTYIISNALSKTYAVRMTLETDHAADIKIYFSSKIRHRGFSEGRSVTQALEANKKTTLTFKIPAIPTTNLRIDPGNQPGSFRFYDLAITQDLGKETVLNHNDIYQKFRPGNDQTRLTLHKDYVELVAKGNTPQLISNGSLLGIPLPVFMFVPILFVTFLLYKILSGYSVEQLVAFFFPCRKQTSTNTSIIQSLDGLRGYAAMLVVAEHTSHSFLGAGRSGVLIFFALSGFLLARPFVSNPAKLFTLSNISNYIQRRMTRIYPVYIFYLFLVYGLTYRLGDFFLHIFFIKGLGHTWTLPQEMAFYLIFPLILAIIHFILRDKLFLTIPFLLVIICGWYKYVPKSEVYLFGMFYSILPFMLPAFLSGTLVSFVYYKKLHNIQLPQLAKNGLLVLALLIIIIFTFFSNAQLFNSREIYAFTHQIEFGLAAGLMILILLCTGENFLTKIFSNPILVSIGVVSYSLYLFHPMVINMVKKLHITGGMRFFPTLIISYFIACFIYHLIEQPLLSTKKK